MKLDNIKSILKNEADLSAQTGIIITGFEDKKLVFEQGIIFTDKTLEENIDNIYDEFILPNKKIDIILIDIIKNISEINSISELQKIDLLNEGVFVGDTKNDKGGFILPNTSGINNIKQSIEVIKQKITFSSNNVNIYKFKTKRLTFND